jgi:hypothetical protein
MSLDTVRSLALNVDLILIWNCEINHKHTKEYVKTPVFTNDLMARRMLRVTRRCDPLDFWIYLTEVSASSTRARMCSISASILAITFR